MPRDPYYRKILEGLGGDLDRDLFEACAVDLLRDAFPSLVPVHGGSDAGMDGAIAEGEGEAYPLVASTSDRVLRNLTESLDSYVENGGQRRKVVLATSAELTPQRRRNLEARADEKEFKLVQVFERRAIADRLYRDSRWARDLLGLTGEPSALSELPRSRRPLREVDLVGREGDLRWLRETAGDLVLVGQPGSGKTYLALELVRAGEALFLASEDQEQVANACRDLEPPAIVVDDAHTDSARLEWLRHLREEIGADFRILATTWPGAEDEVAAALGELPSSHVRRLELLTRKEILEVLRAIGIREPDDDPYLRELVNQSANKPGLAVTLGSLWLRGEWRDVLTGRAIRRSLIPALTQVLGQDPTRLLACFALGGDGGMSFEAVGGFLGVNRLDVHRWATEAAHGGVLDVLSETVLRVQPEVLRSAVLQEAFFTRPAIGDFRQLLKQAPSRSAGVESLVRAALRGVAVPREMLQELLCRDGSIGAWRAFAMLGEREASWVLDRTQGELGELTPEVLTMAPHRAIQRLLHEAEGRGGPLRSQPSPPLRRIQDWAHEIPGSPVSQSLLDETLRRREILVDEARRYLREGGDREVGLRAIAMALSPRLFRGASTGVGDAYSITGRILPSPAVPRMLGLWEKSREEFSELPAAAWRELENSFQAWVYPETLTLGRPLAEAEKTKLLEFPRRVIEDLAAQVPERPGLRLALQQWAHRVHFDLNVGTDHELEVLFPATDDIAGENWREEDEKLRAAAQSLAATWASREPVEASRKLCFYQSEAENFHHDREEAIHCFLLALSRSVTAPADWLHALIEERVKASWVGPFFERVVAERCPGWQEALGHGLEVEEYRWLASMLALRVADLPPELLEGAIRFVPAHLVETSCLRREVPLENLRSLLRDPRQEVSTAAAVGEWLADPKGEVRQEIAKDWRRAILRTAREGLPDSPLHLQVRRLKDVLGADPALGFEWLSVRLRRIGEYEVLSDDGVEAAAIQALNPAQRSSLLGQLEPTYSSRHLIALLVESSLEVYRQLLSQDHLSEHHLAPLGGKVPDAAWAEMAGLALSHGYEPREVAGASLAYEGVISGFGQEHWARWKKGFEALLETATGKLREVAERGIASAEMRIAEAEKRQRQFDLTGHF